MASFSSSSPLRCCSSCSSISSSRRELSTRDAAWRAERDREEKNGRRTSAGTGNAKREKKTKEKMSSSKVQISLSISSPNFNKMLARVGAARVPLLASPLASQRTKHAQRSPLVVRATASPKGHAERAATTASKAGIVSSSTPMATTTSTTSAAQLPFTTALFVRALPGECRFGQLLAIPASREIKECGSWDCAGFF